MEFRFLCAIFDVLLTTQFSATVCQDAATPFNATASRFVSLAPEEQKPWCPPADTILPCTCDGPQSFRMLICDRIEDSYVISRVASSIYNYENFGKFSLINSRMGTLESNILGYLQFEYIYARKNTMRVIEPGFFDSSKDSLKRIEIVHSDLEKFPFKSLSSFPKLEYITLKFNSLKSIPDEAFGKVINNRLKKIDLTYNKISHIGSNAFKNLCKLELLDLRFNKLTVINNFAFAGLQPNPKLTLNLAGNKIAFISEGAFENQVFKCLNLSDNNLGKFPEKIFHNTLKNMVERRTGIISLFNNRFRCTCDNMRWLVRLSPLYKSRIMGLECSDKNNRKIQELSFSDIECGL